MHETWAGGWVPHTATCTCGLEKTGSTHYNYNLYLLLGGSLVPVQVEMSDVAQRLTWLIARYVLRQLVLCRT